MAAQSAMEVYFSRPRAKEHLPTHIAGVQRLAKTECLDDIESIKHLTRTQAATATTQSLTGATTMTGDGSGDVALASEVVPPSHSVPMAAAIATTPLPIATSSATALIPSAAAARAPRRGNVPHLRHRDDNAQTSANRKRQRLEHRVFSERHELEDVLKLSLTQLRGELDSIRTESVSYEEAIASSRREIELAKREKQELDEQFAALKGEYELSVATTETARADEEKAEIELRDRLAQATQIAAEAQGRVDQLQLIETEFKTKDLTITHLREDVNKLNMEVQHLRNALQNKPFAVDGAAGGNAQQGSSPISPSVNGSTADKLLQNVIDYTNKNSSALQSAMHSAGVNVNTNQQAIAAAAKAGANGILMVTGDFIRYVQVHTDRTANASKTIKTLQTERDHLAIQVQEREQLLHTQYAQIERITKFNADLQSTVKVSSALLHEERLKHEQTLKQMQLITEQREDAIELARLFDTKIHAYDSVLQVSDNRAIQAELGIHDNVHELKSLRTGLKSLQLCYNRLLQQHVILQKYHANICELVLNSVGDSVDAETRDMLDSQNMGTATPSMTHGTNRSKKQLPQHIDGYQLQTYESIQDYKRLFQRISDILHSRLYGNGRQNTMTPTAFTLDSPPDSQEKPMSTSVQNGHMDANSTVTVQNGELKSLPINTNEIQELQHIAQPDK